MKKLFKVNAIFVQELLNERRSLGEYKEDQRDFIDVFLNEIDKNINDNSDKNVFTGKTSANQM